MPEPQSNQPLALEVFRLLHEGERIIGRPVTADDRIHIAVSLIVEALTDLPSAQRKPKLQRVIAAMRRVLDAMPRGRPDA